jgi:hypothetical protein
MRSARVVITVAALVAAVLPAKASAAEFAAECGSPDGPATVVVGAVACQRIHSAALGGVSAFSYYVPPACVGQRCPVLFNMHGTGGSYQSQLGPVGGPPNGWVAAETSGPDVDPWTVADPWNHSDIAGWVPHPEIDFVMIAPHNMTVPGGYGPASNDGFWSDWNPKYARDGAQPKYDTPPPRFDTHVVGEVLPWVEAHLPVGTTREYRAITGFSQGGLGALEVGLHHPDLFSMITALSGASIPLAYMPGAATMRSVTPAVGAPAPLPYTPLPGVVPAVYPGRNSDADPTGTNWILTGLRAPFFGYGDPVEDEAYWRGNVTQDLAANARAWAGTTQSMPIDLYDGDAIPRRMNDDTGAAWIEAFAKYIVGVQRVAFDSEEVAYTFRTRPGTHQGLYVRPFTRYWLERLYANVRHPDGGGTPPPAPDRFDFRSIFAHFQVWGWDVAVDREPVEFLTLRDTGCKSVTLQGSGIATVTVPEGCGTGVAGSRTFTVDLGPSYATDEHAMASYTGAYNAATTVHLEPIA